MPNSHLQSLIERAFDDRAAINASTQGEVREAVEAALSLLDRGEARVAEKIEGAEGPASWRVNQWLKKAVLLSFRLNDNRLVEGGPGGATWWDKIPSKFQGWSAETFAAGRISSRAGCDRETFRVYRARCDPDAELCQPGRLRRFENHGRHLGDGRVLRADR